MGNAGDPDRRTCGGSSRDAPCRGDLRKKVRTEQVNSIARRSPRHLSPRSRAEGGVPASSLVRSAAAAGPAGTWHWQAGSQETSRPNGYRVITGLHPSMPDRWGTRARAVRCCCVGRSSDRSKMRLGLLRVKTVGGWLLPGERMERGRNPCRAQAGAAPIHRPGGRRCMHACVDGDARARGDVHG